MDRFIATALHAVGAHTCDGWLHVTTRWTIKASKRDRSMPSNLGLGADLCPGRERVKWAEL